MISEIGELYQEVILDHNKKPRNFGTLKEANRKAEGYNPLCGDRLTLLLKMEGEVIQDIRFQGSGCAISVASASMMTAHLKGTTRAEAERIFEKFHKMVTTGANGESEELGKLAAFSGVSQFPVRVKCASLCWHTLKAALEDKRGMVSTE